MFKLGLKSYFEEFSFKNSTLNDFIRHMSDACKELKIERDFGAWAETWLKSAGCN
jgi:aminopeptidase N